MRRHSILSFPAVLLLSVLPLAACDDDSAGPNGGDEGDLIGTWNAVSITSPAVGGDLIDMGMTFSVTFTDDTYTFNVTGDDDGAFCEDDGPDCTNTGDYTATGTTVTFDPASVDAFTANWNISGSTLTIAGNIDVGVPVTFVFERD